jgi:hypothetical protein
MGNDLGCSAQPEGVDDDQIGVALNYICSIILLVLAYHMYSKYGYQVAKKAIQTEIGMSLGYFFGGLCHGSFANRASDDNCANRYFYPFFAISYLSMIISSLAWLSFASKGSARLIVWWSLLASALLITAGSSWC